MRRSETIVTVASLLFAVALYFAVRDPHLHADEWVHYDEVRRMIASYPRINSALTTLPTYHYLLALPGKFYDPAKELPYVRFFAFCLSALSILTFYRMARSVDSPTSLLRSLQYCFLPILFPFFFLIYTDLFSMAFLILAIHLISRDRYTLAAVAAMGALATRQNNFVWILLCCVLIASREKSIIASLKKAWMFVVVLGAFAVFVILNRGIAIGDRSSHPWGLYGGNVFFMLLLFFVFFLPLHVQNARKIADFVNNHRMSLLLIPVLFLIYFFTFSPTHQYNQAAYSFFLRNQLLLFMTSSAFWKALFFLPMICAVFCLIVTELIDRKYYWIYPASILFLLPSWLIEQRYYLIPFSLFLLTRKQNGSKVENLLLALYVPAALFLFYGITAGKFFL